MNVEQFYKEAVESDAYKGFLKENSGAFFSAGFFVLNFSDSFEKAQLDFFVPGRGVSFFDCRDSKISFSEDKIDSMSEQGLDLKFDLCDIEEFVKKIFVEEKISMDPKKVIAILKDGVWSLVVMDDVLGVVRIKVDAKTGDKISFSKNSFMDMVKSK
jgi:hypothetical protein